MIISFPDKPGKWQNISRTQYKGLLQLLRTLCQRGTYMGETIHYKPSPIHFFPSFRPRSGSGLKQNPHHCQTWRGTLQAHGVQGTSLFSPLDIPWCPHLSKGTFVFIPQTKDMNQDLCILLLSNTIFTVLSQAFIPSVFIHPFMHMTLCLSVLSTKEA